MAYQLFTSIIPIAILGIFLTGMLSYQIIKPSVVESTKRTVETSLSVVSRQLSGFFQQRSNEMELMTKNPLFKDYQNNVEFGLHQEAEAYRQDIASYLSGFISRSRSSVGMWYLSGGGKVIVSIEQTEALLPAIKKSKRGFLAPFTAGDLTSLQAVRLVGPVRDEQLGQMVLHVAPVFDEAHRTTGALVLASSLHPINQIIETLSLGEHGEARVANEQGILLASWNQSPEIKKSPHSNMFSLRQQIENTPWHVSLNIDLNDFLQPLNRLYMLMLLLSIFSAFAVASFIYFRVNMLIKPVQKLTEAAERLRTGDLSQRVEVSSSNEIGELSEAFNAMADSLQSRTIDLEKRVVELRALADQNAALLSSIRTSELRYRTTLDSSLDAIVGLNASFFITTWNKGAEILFGYKAEHVLNQPLRAFLSEEVSTKILEMAQKSNSIVNYDINGVSKSGRKLDLNLTLAGAQVNGQAEKDWSMVIRDVTEQKALQTQLIQADKLSMVGKLVAGVAHEINNPLTAVIGYTELIVDTTVLDPNQVKEDVSYIYENAIRCRDIVGNLLRFVRKEAIQKNVVDINEVIRNVLKLMDYRLTKKESVRVKWQPVEALPKIIGDARQLEQVFLNLIHNACDAMSDLPYEKIIQIKTEHKGDHLEIRVSDNGKGIPKGIVEKIFEPFFTTKGIGKGTGLGLMLCERIVQECNGTIGVESEEGNGASFIITLPVSQLTAIASLKNEFNFPPVVDKRILIIEDEDDLLELMGKVLTEEGNVVEKTNLGKAGFNLMNEKDFDLVITDIELGDANGVELWRKVRDRKPKMKFAFVTGDFIDPQVISEVVSYGALVLFKPFSVKDFLLNIRGLFSDAISIRKNTEGVDVEK